MTRLPLADRVMKARRDSTCPLCTEPVRQGQLIARCGIAWYHAACVARHVTADFPAAQGAGEQSDRPVTRTAADS